MLNGFSIFGFNLLTNMQHILAIDLGTSHCKAVIVTKMGEVLNTWQVISPSISNEPGQHEQDADELFNRVIGLMKNAFESSAGSAISCVCFSAAMHGLMAVDAAGKPLTNLITWADTRSDVYAKQLLKQPIALKIYQHTGPPIHSMTPLCKLLWMKAERKEIFDRAYKFISLKEYIFFRLFNKYIIDCSIAAATGYFDIYTKTWNADALTILSIGAEKLSTPVEVTHAETALLPYYQSLFNIQQQVSFVTGASDGTLANLGCGAVTKDKLAITIGTSGAVRVVVPQPFERKLNTVFIYLLTEGMYVVGGPTNNGGNVLQWFVQQVLQRADVDKGFNEALMLAESIGPGAEGLIFLPYINGERAPVWDALAKGAFIGLTARHNQSHLARAVVESICYAVYDVFFSMENLKDDVQVIYASGGFTKSDFWVQLVADIFGKKVMVNDVADASAIGAAMIGMLAQGWIKDISEAQQMVKEGKAFLPDMDKHQQYQKVFAMYRSLYLTLKDSFAEMDVMNAK